MDKLETEVIIKIKLGKRSELKSRGALGSNGKLASQKFDFCSLGKVTDMPDKENLDHIERFGAISKEYLEDLNNTLKFAGGNGLYFYHKKIELILENLESTPIRILDFGCAIGLLTKLMAANFSGSQVIGYDPSQDCIKEAKSKIVPGLSNLNFVDRLEEITEQFDLIVVAGVFHHIPWKEKASAMRSISKLLEKNGKCFLFEHNPYGPLGRLILAFSPLDRGADLQTINDSEKLFQGAEMKVLKKQYISFFPPFMRPLLGIEQSLAKVPFGAQYMIISSN